MRCQCFRTATTAEVRIGMHDVGVFAGVTVGANTTRTELELNATALVPAGKINHEIRHANGDLVTGRVLALATRGKCSKPRRPYCAWRMCVATAPEDWRVGASGRG